MEALGPQFWGKFKKALNFALRFVSGRRKHDHISDVMDELKWLNSRQLVAYCDFAYFTTSYRQDDRWHYPRAITSITNWSVGKRTNLVIWLWISHVQAMPTDRSVIGLVSCVTTHVSIRVMSILGLSRLGRLKLSRKEYCGTCHENVLLCFGCRCYAMRLPFYIQFAHFFRLNSIWFNCVYLF